MRAVSFLLWVLLVALQRPSVAVASPWAQGDDEQLRQDVQVLAAFGILEGPTLSWPLAWSQLEALDGDGVSRAPLHVRRAAARVASRAAAARRSLGGQLEAGASTAPAALRKFEAGPRAAVDVEGQLFAQGERGFIQLGGSYRSPQWGSDVQPDQSIVALRLGSYDLYAGYVAPIWGPSSVGNLSLTNSARPFPKVGFRRMQTKGFDTPWLSWLGPYRIEAFVGVLDEPRDARNVLVVGMRAELRPLPQWEIGLTRVMQLCGQGRPCDGATWLRALVGVGDLDNTGTPQEPGNQLAALETRALFSVRGYGLTVFGAVLAEDEGKFTIYRFAQQWGASLNGGLGGEGASFDLSLDYVDTRSIEYVVFGERRPGVIYNHHIYRDGYRYRGRAIGFSLDGDSRLGSAAFSVSDLEQRRYYVAARVVDLSRYAFPGHSLSSSHETFGLFEVGFEMPIPRGELRVEVRLQTDSPDTPGQSAPAVQLEGGYLLAF
jgi:hypothetical protein